MGNKNKLKPIRMTDEEFRYIYDLLEERKSKYKVESFEKRENQMGYITEINCLEWSLKQLQQYLPEFEEYLLNKLNGK